MEKRGDIWVSAVLYFGIGIVVLTIILAAGLPVINKLRDKNVIIQTKQIMHTLDENIREVIREGPGSQRVVTLSIKKGSFVIDEENDNKIAWIYKNSKIPISEPNEIGRSEISAQEGNLEVVTIKSAVEKNYDIKISIDYTGLADIAKSEGSLTIVGLSDLVIRNVGIKTIDNLGDIVTGEGTQVLRIEISEANG